MKRLSYEEVKEYIENKGCKLLSNEYIKINDLLKIQCSCGRIFNTSFMSFKNSNKTICGYCEGHMIWDFDSIKYFIEVESKSGCKLLSNYFTKVKDKIEIRCQCGETFNTTFEKFYKRDKRQCNKCSFVNSSIKNIKPFVEVKNYIEVESNSRCKVLSEDYIDISKNVLVLCHCGNTFIVNYSRFKHNNKRECNECSRTNKLSYADVKTYIETNSNSKLLSKKYKNDAEKLLLLCECGNEYYVNFNNFKNKKRYKCKQCTISDYSSRKIDKYRMKFNDKVKEICGEEYVFLDEYKRSNTKIRVKHNLCENIYSVKPNNFLNGRRCPYCAESRGEQRIRKWLESNTIESLPQYILSDCKRIECLPFDFAIFKDKEKTKLKCLIEYDGEFHFEPILGSKQLKYQQENDKIKDKYCIQKNIPLIRIPYWNFNEIEQILETELNKLSNKAS